MNVTDQFQICLVQFLIIDRTWNWSEIIFFLFHIFKFNIYIYVYICISYTTTSIEQLVRTKTPNSEVTSLNLLQGNSPQLNSSLSRVKAGPIQSSFFFFLIWKNKLPNDEKSVEKVPDQSEPTDYRPNDRSLNGLFFVVFLILLSIPLLTIALRALLSLTTLILYLFFLPFSSLRGHIFFYIF